MIELCDLEACNQANRMENASTGVFGAIVAVVVLAASWALRSIIEQSVKADFDAKLEVLKASLTAKDAEIAALRTGALAVLKDRHVDLDKRRLIAAERLWSDVAARRNLRLLAQIMQNINVEETLRRVKAGRSQSRGFSDFSESMLKIGKIDELKHLPNVESERPFLSPIVWALYQAYSAILAYPIAFFGMLSIGEAAGLADGKKIIDLVKVALPHRSGFLDEVGLGGIFYLIDEVEEALLSAIRTDLKGRDSDDDALAQASRILEKVEQAKSADGVPRIPTELERKSELLVS